MYYNHYEIERIVKEILDKLGKEVDVKANLKTQSDCYSYIYGDDESYTSVKGLRYHFDKMDILGYHYNHGYYFSVNYNRFGREPYGYYEKKEDGQIINKNNEIWETYLLELYDSLDDLVRNQEAEKNFFDRIRGCLKWPELDYWADRKEAKKYIKELDITLSVYQYLSGYEYTERNRVYRIYEGSNCVYDSEAEIFIDGPWKDNLIKYMLMLRKKEEELKKTKEKQDFSKSLQRLRSIRKN